MKSIFIFAFVIVAFSANAQQPAPPVTADSTKPILVVETACGQCLFHQAGAGCDLAVRLNGKTYFADGIDIDTYGDAHGQNGFCNTVRKARVQGALVNGRFKPSYFELLPLTVATAGTE